MCSPTSWQFVRIEHTQACCVMRTVVNALEMNNDMWLRLVTGVHSSNKCAICGVDTRNGGADRGVTSAAAARIGGWGVRWLGCWLAKATMGECTEA